VLHMCNSRNNSFVNGRTTPPFASLERGRTLTLWLMRCRCCMRTASLTHNTNGFSVTLACSNRLVRQDPRGLLHIHSHLAMGGMIDGSVPSSASFHTGSTWIRSTETCALASCRWSRTAWTDPESSVNSCQPHPFSTPKVVLSFPPHIISLTSRSRPRHLHIRSKRQRGSRLHRPVSTLQPEAKEAPTP
jgi:hypothetical protein